AVQPLKNAEELVVIAHVESDSVILDTVHRFILQFLTAYLHARLIALGGVFDRIADEIYPYLAQHRAIAQSRRQRGYFDSADGPRASAYFRATSLTDGNHVDCRGFQVFAPEPRKRQQVVNQLGHSAGFLAHYGKPVLRFFIKLRPVVFFQHARIAADRSQRRAQVVRYRVAKALEFLVRRLELLGTYGHAGLELLALGYVLDDANEVLRRAGCISY